MAICFVSSASRTSRRSSSFLDSVQFFWFCFNFSVYLTFNVLIDMRRAYIIKYRKEKNMDMKRIDVSL
jgi:hypothetical protein